MSTAQGWSALQNGELSRAEGAFAQALRQDNQDYEALLGMAKVLVSTGMLQEATTFANQARAMRDNLDTQLLRAEVMSAQGKRNEALAVLRFAEQTAPNNPYIKALQAEQRIRQGYWDDGTALFIQALSNDPDGVAFPHLIKVMSDMSGAVAAGRIRPDDAQRMINRLENSIPRTSPQVPLFMAAARRALQSRQPLPPPEIKVTTARFAGGSGGGSRGGSAPPPVRDMRQQRQSSTRSAPSSASSSTRSSTRRSTRGEPQRQLNTGLDVDIPELRMISGNEFLETMRRDRIQNEELQKNLVDIGRLTWPTEHQNDLDTIPPLESADVSMDEQIRALQDDPFRLTDGSVFSAIYIDRAIQAIMNALPVQLAGTILVHPNEFSWLELNALDGLLDNLEPLQTSDLDFDDSFNTSMSLNKFAMGAFLGRAIERYLNGVWEYKNDPERSTLRVSSESFSPFEMANRWFSASKNKRPNLARFGDEARGALHPARFNPARYEFIDLTKDLSGQPLRVRLAELWMLYRVKLASATLSAIELVGDIELLGESEDAIIFALRTSRCPDLGIHPRGLIKGEHYAVAYLRKTGEFLFMARPDDFARVANATQQNLDAQSVRELFDMIESYFCPAGTLVRTANQAQRAAQLSGADVSAPSLRARGETGQLTFWVFFNNKATEYTLTCSPENPSGWTLT